jgi:hypothetical protein
MYPIAATETLADLGSKYQFRLLYYTCALGDFGREILPHLAADMFDQTHYKQLVTLIRSYWDKYGQLPNADNLRLSLPGQSFLSPVDREVLGEEIDKFVQLRSMLSDGRAHNDSVQVIELAWAFIKDRAMRSIRQEMDTMCLLRDYGRSTEVLHRYQNAMQIGYKEVLPVSPLEVNRAVWINRYPNAVPTGIRELDEILPGGLPPGKLGLVLGGQGVGKSSFLTLLADNAWALGYSVLHVVFDENDIETEVKPKYQAKWSGIPVDKMRYHLDEMEASCEQVRKERYGKGNVLIHRFDSAETTVRVLKTWIKHYEERFGIHFDLIVLDYIDEFTPEGRNTQQFQGEVEIVKSFHSMLVELKRPGWTATQAKKESNIKRLLYHDDCGGSVAKIKKAQVVLTLGADQEEKKANRLNLVLLKSNISKCGHIWEDCLFDRDTLVYKMGQSTGYAPAEEVRKMYDEDSGEALPDLGSSYGGYTGLPSRAQVAGHATEPVPTLATNEWRGSFPESQFESESTPITSPVREEAAQAAADSQPSQSASVRAMPNWSPPLAAQLAHQTEQAALVAEFGEALDML